MAEENSLIVIKRIKKVAAGHHGGAWKIAYADFVTAMMALQSRHKQFSKRHRDDHPLLF